MFPRNRAWQLRSWAIETNLGRRCKLTERESNCVSRCRAITHILSNWPATCVRKCLTDSLNCDDRERSPRSTNCNCVVAVIDGDNGLAKQETAGGGAGMRGFREAIHVGI